MDKSKILFVFMLYCLMISCRKPCPSDQEIYNRAKSVNIPDSDKRNFPFSIINKIIFLLNDTSLITFNLTSKNGGYERGDGDVYNDNGCGEYAYKYERNDYEYKSSSSMLPGIRMFIKTTNEKYSISPANYSDFEILMCNHYLSNGSVDDYFSLSGTTGSEFDLSKFVKLDTIKTSFDSIYFNVYKINLFKYVGGSPAYVYDEIYYSVSKGICKIIDSNKNKFELVKVE